jgi:Type II CAAX prenyl endopeptidase Rce1-like
MPLGKEIGLGPALRVVRHVRERKRLERIKFASGEQALVLIAGMPAPSIELVRLVLAGFLPWQTVWEFNPMRAGGYSDYIHKLRAMFSPAADDSDDSLPHLRDDLLRCRSISEARALLLNREREANSSPLKVAMGLTKKHPSISAESDDGWELGTFPHQAAHSAERVKPLTVANRYRIRNALGERVLSCVEAPNVMVREQRRAPVPSKQVRKAPAGTIFLGGAAEGEPFADFEAGVYHLNHQQGSIQFLSTCEQAMVLVRKLLDLRSRDWAVVTKDGELGTVFAVWVLLNHPRLNANSAALARVMPLLRLEGVIDVHGLEASCLSALSADALRSTSAALKRLQQQELDLKRYGRWCEIDLLEYIADQLRAIDDVIYSPQDFEGVHEIEELARGEITNQSIVIVCRSEAPFKDIESQVRKTYGERLRVLIVQNASSDYEIHQINQTTSGSLERAYDRLNLLDPAAQGGSQNRWHGSAILGASPRGVETKLSPDQIVAAVRDAFRQPSILDVLFQLPRAMWLALIGLSPALLLIVVGNLLRNRGYIAPGWVDLFAIALPVTAAILFWLKARGAPGIHGLRAPMSFAWLIVLPGAVIAAVAGGVWTPRSLGFELGHQNEFSGLIALLLPIGAELLFRGVILGSLALCLPIQTSGQWQRSWPTLISGGLYAAASVLLLFAFSNGQAQTIKLLVTFAAALAFGMASGTARERSESIFSSIVLHTICAAALMLSGGFPF